MADYFFDDYVAPEAGKGKSKSKSKRKGKGRGKDPGKVTAGARADADSSWAAAATAGKGKGKAKGKAKAKASTSSESRIQAQPPSRRASSRAGGSRGSSRAESRRSAKHGSNKSGGRDSPPRDGRDWRRESRDSAESEEAPAARRQRGPVTSVSRESVADEPLRFVLSRAPPPPRPASTHTFAPPVGEPEPASVDPKATDAEIRGGLSLALEIRRAATAALDAALLDDAANVEKSELDIFVQRSFVEFRTETTEGKSLMAQLKNKRKLFKVQVARRALAWRMPPRDLAAEVEAVNLGKLRLGADDADTAAMRELAFLQRAVALHEDKILSRFCRWLVGAKERRVSVARVVSIVGPLVRSVPPELVSVSLASPLFARSRTGLKGADEAFAAKKAREEEEAKACTFKPAISDKSREIARIRAAAPTGDAPARVAPAASIFDRLYPGSAVATGSSSRELLAMTPKALRGMSKLQLADMLSFLRRALDKRRHRREHLEHLVLVKSEARKHGAELAKLRDECDHVTKLVAVAEDLYSSRSPMSKSAPGADPASRVRPHHPAPEITIQPQLAPEDDYTDCSSSDSAGPEPEPWKPEPWRPDSRYEGILDPARVHPRHARRDDDAYERDSGAYYEGDGAYYEDDEGAYYEDDEGAYGEDDEGAYGEDDEGAYGEDDEGVYYEDKGAYGEDDGDSGNHYKDAGYGDDGERYDDERYEYDDPYYNSDQGYDSNHDVDAEAGVYYDDGDDDGSYYGDDERPGPGRLSVHVRPDLPSPAQALGEFRHIPAPSRRSPSTQHSPQPPGYDHTSPPLNRHAVVPPIPHRRGY
ncbi:uncharacterized protein AMSG_04407 [Thecamonas trahens ATCC 50062]|uniref:Uncharacterized protein n=1 Tax=Thecamonas trahens ATCC 50062 TaxID=461836 RepID=A0A0L0D758_THETB|nr:hypothetical protein AMSG_04407 [Thecamonas trahens ATCC 50062]KNC48179.1 hypothetical protein AMSG_04407 [Thecamonas trahens ATCC 50062]|eukprot:XP_013758749.1 hypothetical protein AMSG_04407 [Thecamonas trahens ATCC 50062]